jgi:hypothetical protein
MTRFLLLSDRCGVVDVGLSLSDERTGLSFTISAGPRQCSYPLVRVPRDLCPYFTLSDSRIPKPGGPGPYIYILQEEGGSVTPPNTGFPFCRLLYLAGPRWSYSTLPPCDQPQVNLTSIPLFFRKRKVGYKRLKLYCSPYWNQEQEQNENKLPHDKKYTPHPEERNSVTSHSRRQESTRVKN